MRINISQLTKKSIHSWTIRCQFQPPTYWYASGKMNVYMKNRVEYKDGRNQKYGYSSMRHSLNMNMKAEILLWKQGMPSQRIKATQIQKITRVRQISFQTRAATQAQTETKHTQVFLVINHLSDVKGNKVGIILNQGILFRAWPQAKPNNLTQNKEPDQMHEPKVKKLSNRIISDNEIKVLGKG